MRIPILNIIPAFCLFITLSATSMNPDLLPTELDPWSTSKDTIYTPANLYDYIDGGAELYISYGFRKVQSRRYAADNQPDIVVDVFDMNTSADAYGVFMYSAEELSDLVGQGTQYNEGFMLFWMDHYFVSIMAYPETPESKEAVMQIARTIEKRIGKKGELPGILEYLPERGLNPGSIRYFHHYAWLNSHYYIAAENILLIGDDTRAVLAKYGDKDPHSILLIVQYPSGERAEEAAGSFTDNYLPEIRGKSSLRIEDGTYTGIERAGRTLILVFNAPDEQEATGLIRQVKDRLKTNQK